MKTTKILKWLPMLALAAIMAAGCGDECEPCKPAGETYPQNVPFAKLVFGNVMADELCPLRDSLMKKAKLYPDVGFDKVIINSKEEWDEKVNLDLYDYGIDFDKYTFIACAFNVEPLLRKFEEKITKLSADEYEYTIRWYSAKYPIATLHTYYFFTIIDKISDSANVKFNVEIIKETIK